MSNDADQKPDHALLRTPEAARLLRVQSQSMRRWACRNTGPLKPIKVGGRLLWRAADIKRLTQPSREMAA